MQFDSYEMAGAVIAVDLVNAVTGDHAVDRSTPSPDPLPAIRGVLQIDPPSAARLDARDAPGFVELAWRLREVFTHLDHDETDAAAGRLNDLLAVHVAHPHLAKEQGRWRLHHHSVDAALLPMITAICAEGLARVISAGAGGRLGTCADSRCDRVFLDATKNGRRRYCSTRCQNRVKAAAFRHRRSAAV